MTTRRVELRQSEVDTLVSALEHSIDHNYPSTDAYNARVLRLIKKLTGKTGR